MKKGVHKLIDRTAEYLHSVMGIKCEKVGDGFRDVRLPYYLKAGNIFAEYAIDTQRCLFVAVGEMPDGTTMANRVGEICKLTNRKVVLVLENIDAVRRRVLIANRTCFVVPGKQAYLPFLGALLMDRGLDKMEVADKHTFSLAAQVLFLSHLEREPLEGRIISEVAQQFPYSVKTVSAAAKELEEAGVCTIEGDNSGKYLHFIAREEIWNVAYPWLTSPVQKVLYCDNKGLMKDVPHFVTYDKALSEYTFMADFSGESYAVYKNDDTVKKLKNGGAFNSVEGKCRIELWKYNPALLAKGEAVDALSLALCYKDCDDERVAGELNQLVDKICKA